MYTDVRPHPTKRRQHSASRVLLTVMSLVCALVTVAVSRAVPAIASGNRDAPLASTFIASNNIRGASTLVKGTWQSNGTTESKWSHSVRGLIQSSHIVFIQEAGASGPPSARALGTITTDDGAVIQHFEWNVGTDRNGGSATGTDVAQVYFLQTDDNGGTQVGGRVNLATLTRDRPDDFMVVRNPNARGRTALGVRFGHNWYFNVHGLAYGPNRPNDSAALLGAINSAVANYTAPGITGSFTYTVGGDFNMDPADLAARGIPNGARILDSGQVTYTNLEDSAELDYFVTNDQSRLTPLSNGRYAEAEGLALSDHAPVRIGRLGAAADPPDLKAMNQTGKCGIGSPCLSDIGAMQIAKDWALSYQALSIYKRTVRLVGDDTTTAPDGTPQEGSVGESISADASLDATAIPKYMPNVVMLQAGTHELLNGGASSAPGQLSALIDQIQAADPIAVVLVAPLDPMADPANEALVTAFNTAVQQSVAAKAAAGRRVVWANLLNMTTVDLNADGVTPNASGQQKVADAFTGAMVQAVELGWISEPVAASAPSGSVCDIYAYYGTPCVGAYSMTRAMFSDYDGPLYEVQRTSDGQSQDIGLLAPGGDVDASQQDSFCANTTCQITAVFDQSYQLNDLLLAPAGGGANPNPGQAADAAALKITVGGHEAYGLKVTPGVGYRDNFTRGVATDDKSAGIHTAEGMYMVASGINVNSGCCFDFGNAETNSQDNGEGHMDAVNLSTTCYYQSSQGPCTGNGPWVEADLENGLFQGKDGTNTANTGNSSDFVTAMLKNDGADKYAIKGGDAQSGGLSTYWSGGLPSVPGQYSYTPMQKEGAIILGTGGDNSNSDVGSFFEGVMTDGYPSDAADSAVQADITAAKYAGDSAGNLSAPSAAGPAVLHDGYSSMFTVDSANGHLEESYLAQIGGAWASHDLNTLAKTPPVMPGTTPVSLVHGDTSVFTVAADNGDLWETYLPKLGGPWFSQDLSAKYHTPNTSWTPTAVVHDGYTSVYTVDAANGHLRETYLPKLGDDWVSQDLSDKYHTPAVQAGTSPVAIVHSGYTSVYTIGPDHHLEETYLIQLGQDWHTQDLSAKYLTPPTAVTPTAVVHGGYTSVYTVDDVTRDLEETYLPAIGDDWKAQDLSAEYHTPPVAPGTQPVALFHTGFTSVYTVAEGSQHVWESYLPYLGDGWGVQDFTAKYQTPVTSDTPAVLLHPASGGDLWSSVFTVNEFNDHLNESYLPKIGDDWTSHDLSVLGNTPGVAVTGSSQADSSLAHDGYTSVFTPDGNGGLRETYLNAMGGQWAVHDLASMAQTPKIMAGTGPISLEHQGYTSVFTIDDGSGDLEETYLAQLGGSWASHDLASIAHTPPSATIPTAVFHSGYTSVYTVDRSNGHLDETYLPALGGPWYFQDLTAKYSTPPVAKNSEPAAILHDGWVSVFTIDGNAGGQFGDVEETYLNAIGDGWATHDLTQLYSVQQVALGSSPRAVFHNGFTSVYTVGQNGDILENYLPAIGDNWVPQDLSSKYGLPKIGAGNRLTALYHTGFTSLYSIQANGDLNESYLPAIGDAWGSLDLTTKTNAPAPDPAVGLTAVLHADTSGALTWTSVFTEDKGSDQLRETYLPAIGGNWVSQVI
ncbi:hypothetical protein ABH920_007957 [Catenulispora sp. EB89]|uniref:arabinofuranosidase catalytic domain-containing protein n=1 Tax=Catenulispora sp. EB89 TaxID=3156257 RepID=UPI0035189BA0